MGFEAKFVGRCDACHRPIAIGEEIEFTRVRYTRYTVHTACRHLPIVYNQDEVAAAVAGMPLETMRAIVTASINRLAGLGITPNADATMWLNTLNEPAPTVPHKVAGVVLQNLCRQRAAACESDARKRTEAEDEFWRNVANDIAERRTAR